MGDEWEHSYKIRLARKAAIEAEMAERIALHEAALDAERIAIYGDGSTPAPASVPAAEQEPVIEEPAPTVSAEPETLTEEESAAPAKKAAAKKVAEPSE
jgi:hypothetical protein